MTNLQFPRRVLVVGFDGATFDILNPLLAEGRMPTLAQLMDQGTSGIMASVLPTNSVAAWVSFMTGANPGRHGIFTFADHLQETDGRQPPVSARSIRCPTLWDHLHRHGKRQIVLNVPVTYPPTPVDGIMVTGLLTPSLQDIAAHPQAFGAELHEQVPTFRTDLDWLNYRDRPDALMDDLETMTTARFETALLALEKVPDFDFFQVVFVGPDRLQHCMWRYLEPDVWGEPSEEAARLRERIYRHFAQLDTYLKGLIAAVGPDVSVLVLSDHGFAGTRKQFMVNRWLESQGWLRHQTSLKGAVLKRLGGIKAVQQIGRKYLRERAIAMHADVTAGAIDWSNTQAYSSLQGENCAISINLQGREPNGIVSPASYNALRDRIRTALESARDPATGDPLISSIHFRDEIYSGPYVEQAPDLLFEPGPYISTSIHIKEEQLASTEWMSGNHDIPGIAVMAGPGIRPASLDGAKIVDMAPTILHLMDLPVPQEMDGRVWTEGLTPELLVQRPVRVEDAAGDEPSLSDETAYSEEEQKDIEEQLRGLGYM